MPDGTPTNEGFCNLSHLYGSLHTDIHSKVFYGTLKHDSIHAGGQHAHIICSPSIQTPRAPCCCPSKIISSSYYYRYLYALLDCRGHFFCHTIQYLQNILFCLQFQPPRRSLCQVQKFSGHLSRVWNLEEEASKQALQMCSRERLYEANCSHDASHWVRRLNYLQLPSCILTQNECGMSWKSAWFLFSTGGPWDGDWSHDIIVKWCNGQVSSRRRRRYLWIRSRYAAPLQSFPTDFE